MVLPPCGLLPACPLRPNASVLASAGVGLASTRAVLAGLVGHVWPCLAHLPLRTKVGADAPPPTRARSAAQVMGLPEKAIALLREGLQRDPDSLELASKLKRLRQRHVRPGG